jgi:endo-1,4-beta-xylanase
MQFYSGSLLKFGILLLGLGGLWMARSHLNSSNITLNSVSLVAARPTTAQKTPPNPNPDAEQQIQTLRTRPVQLTLVDRQGRPVVGAQIQWQQQRHQFPFGTALSSEVFAEKVAPRDRAQYLQLARRLFNASVMENALKWYATEPQRGKISYQESDRILAWSQQQQMPMRGHTLFWEVDQAVQPWVQSLSAAELRRAMQQRTEAICRRYRGKIRDYDLFNEMLHGDFSRRRLGQGIVRDVTTWCRRVDPGAQFYVNEYDILNGKRLSDYVQQIRQLQQQGVPIGGIGIQAHIREPMTIAQYQRALDTLAQFKLPITITEISILADSDAEQARVLQELYTTAFAHPAVNGIYLWGFWEGAHWEPKTALYRQNWQEKPAAAAYQDLVLNRWWTQKSLTSDRAGQATLRAFYGTHQVTIVQGNRRLQRSVVIAPEVGPAAGDRPQVITIQVSTGS